MNLKEIKTAVNSGKIVCWVNDGQQVLEQNGDYFIVCLKNRYATGLTDINGVMHEKECDFYIKTNN